MCPWPDVLTSEAGQRASDYEHCNLVNIYIFANSFRQEPFSVLELSRAKSATFFFWGVERGRIDLLIFCEKKG